MCSSDLDPAYRSGPPAVGSGRGGRDYRPKGGTDIPDPLGDQGGTGI